MGSNQLWKTSAHEFIHKRGGNHEVSVIGIHNSTFRACLHVTSNCPSPCQSLIIVLMVMDRLQERTGTEPIVSIALSVVQF